jgi:hypothetical protein
MARTGGLDETSSQSVKFTFSKSPRVNPGNFCEKLRTHRSKSMRPPFLPQYGHILGRFGRRGRGAASGVTDPREVKGEARGMLRKRALVLLLVLAGSAQTALADASMDRVLKELEPEERAHQVCNLRGIDAVRKGSHLTGVDRVTTTIQKPAVFKDNVVTAKGGAVRAKNRWYFLDFTCAVSDDQMRAKTFSYKLGGEIPEDKWENFGLWK